MIQYEVEEDEIFVTIYDVQIDPEVEELSNYDNYVVIDKQLFWNWVEKKGLNQFCSDYFGHVGHQQLTGVYTQEQYFDICTYEQIKKDLTEYLKQLKKI